MEGFKTIKNQRKSVLTRHCNTLTRLLEEQDADGINDRLRSMKLTMEQLEQAHYDYLIIINNNNNNNGRNGSCLTWLATSLEEKRRWLIINASPRGQCSK